MPPADETNFVFNEIIATQRFGIPAITTDRDLTEVAAHNNVKIPSLDAAEDTVAYLLERARQMDRFEPLPVEIELDGETVLSQLVHYDESDTIGQLRVMPYVQLLFVGLFILVGYTGFSYVRRSEQDNLWVGMAKEAAHQLGTPISGMMGWAQMLEAMEPEQVRKIGSEMNRDINRLQRVASRFSKIGSHPDLHVVKLEPLLNDVVEYMNRRMPSHGQTVELAVDVQQDLEASLNVELFEWVLENLIKNALDALENNQGNINVKAYRDGERIRIDVIDTGRGIEKRQSKNIFRPGYSTKKRGWGLGLSLAKRIVEDYHGGRLELVSSAPGAGSTFRVTL
jgi:signal transduction histidine kinase